MPDTQNLQNHARNDPLYHRFLLPILLLHFIWSAWNMSQNFSLATAEALLLSIGLIVLGLFARLNALRAQDRVIRLEEQLRCQRLGIPGKLDGLAIGQIVALRFAPDAEMPGLIDQVAAGKLTSQKEIKAAIKNWRPDNVRV